MTTNNLINATLGDILYFDGTDWTRLEPGVDGYALVTHGVGVPPTWGNGSGGGGGLPGGPAGGDLSGTYPNPQVVNFHLPGQVAGSMTYFNGTNWVPVFIPPPNYFLGSDGLSPVWSQFRPLNKVIYVDSTIAISGNGSIVNPYKTIDEAISSSNNATIILATGTYSENLSIASGSLYFITGMSVNGNFTNTNFNGNISLNSNANLFLSNLNIVGNVTSTGVSISGGNYLVFNQCGYDGNIVDASGFLSVASVGLGIWRDNLFGSGVVRGNVSIPNGFFFGQQSVIYSNIYSYKINTTDCDYVGDITLKINSSLPESGIEFQNGCTFEDSNIIVDAVADCVITFRDPTSSYNWKNSSFSTINSVLYRYLWDSLPNISGQTEGDIIYFNSGDWTRLPAGTDGQVLKLSTGYPSWQNESGGSGGNFGISAGTEVFTNGTVNFSNSNGLSFGLSGSVLTGSYTVPSTAGLISGVNFSAGTSSNNLSTVVFSNSNGVSFGLSNNIITASVAGGSANINISAGTTSNNLTNFVFSNSNNVSFGLTGSTITASVPTQTSLSFSNLNGISFGQAGSTLTASYTVPSTANLISRINVSAGTTSNNLTNFVFSNSNNVSFGLNGSTITASVPTQTSVSYSNVNGISFGLAGSTLTASYTVPSTANLISRINVSAGTTSNNLTNFVFSNSNGMSFGVNGSTITGSYSVPSTAGLLSNFKISAGGSSTNLSALTFSNSNGLSFGLSGSTITGSYTVPNTNGLISGIYVSAGTTTNNFSGLVFTNQNNFSFGLVGSVISGSYTVPSTAGLLSNFAVSAGTTSNNLTALSFVNSNNVSFGLNAGSVTATVSKQLNFNPVVNFNTNRNLLATDVGGVIVLNSGSTSAITILTNAVEPMAIGSRISVIVTTPSFAILVIQGASGVTLYNQQVLIGQLPYRLYHLDKLDTDTWVITCDTKYSNEIYNQSGVTGTTVTDAINNINKFSPNGISIPIIPLLGTASWSGGITNHYQGIGVGGAMGIAIPLYPNLTLTSIIVTIEPNTGHGALPAGMPFVQCWIAANAPHGSAGLAGSVTDSSPNVTAYQLKHTITLTLGTPLTVGNSDSCWIRINDETGISGLKLISVIGTYA